MRSASVKKAEAEHAAEIAAYELLKRKKRKLKPSGCLTSLYIDPDVSDDEDNVIKKMRKKEEEKNTAQR